ncbi:hypothetical protein NFI96_001355 [Prochilodus magdalenae]|nr:hypothetical protein NFI96_001355 [Prochilodus magdalenae]
MPAILVASKMKSGLPKPVHSALPIPQSPGHRRAGQNSSPKPSHTSLIPLRNPLSRRQSTGAPQTKSQAAKEKAADPQEYAEGVVGVQPREGCTAPYCLHCPARFSGGECDTIIMSDYIRISLSVLS